MMWVLAAVAWAGAAYLWTTRQLLPTRSDGSTDGAGARRARAAKPVKWSVTRRAMTFLGWTPTFLRLCSAISAVSVVLVWGLLVQDPLAALCMGIIGWQLPSLWVETRAAQGLSGLHRQFAELVSFMHDQLHSHGSTVESAMMNAAKTFTADPLASILQGYVSSVTSGLSLRERLQRMRRAIDLPTADFFFELLLLRDQSGAEDLSHAFDSLDEKLQDDEHVQSLVQGEVRMHSLLLVAGFLVNIVIFPAYRLDSADWPAIHAHLSALVSLSAVLNVVVFFAIRRFTKMQLTVGHLS